MNYQPLFSLEMRHDYYADGMCPDFDIVPTARTQQLLANYRCVLQPFAWGLRVMTQVAANGTAFITLPDTLQFEFALRLNNPDFVLFTDLSGTLRQGAMLVNRAGSNALQVAEISSAPVQSATASSGASGATAAPGPAAAPSEPAVFAAVRLTLGGAARVLPQPDWQFQLAFQARQCRWKYYVLLNKPSQGGGAASQPVILDTDNRIVFAPADARDLTQNPDSSDKLAQQLARQYPELQCWRLRSNALVACRQAPGKTLQLQLNGEKVLDALPAPPPQNFVLDVQSGQASGPGSGPAAGQTEDGLYYTLKYFTR